MKYGKTGITAVLLGVAFAAASFAAAAAPAPSKPLHAFGKISAVDAAAMSLTIAAAGKSETFSYTAATAILENGKPVAASKLAVGADVKIAYEMSAAKNVAKSISIGVPKPAAKPK